jgi:inorganic phosphate transporter, PiT family
MLGLDGGMFFVLILCILAACVFEFINGFHDTANAVATVIYTKSMKPLHAVIWSGICNFGGVYFGGITVAVGVINLLPSTALMDLNVSHSIAMILALLLTAILWNLGTWYLGIPCSSSHTLLGSIFGVGIAYGFMPEAGNVVLNWGKFKDVAIWLLLSPVVGFAATMLLVVILKKFIKNKKFFKEPNDKKAPPFWTRLLLIFSSTFLSFEHGRNDGQKGVGLVMIILISIVPAYFAVNHKGSPETLLSSINKIEMVVSHMDTIPGNSYNKGSLTNVHEKLDSVQATLAGVKSFDALNGRNSKVLRNDIMIIDKELKKLTSPLTDEKMIEISKADKTLLKESTITMKGYIDYSPNWVIFMISLSLGIGTMIGWKRIVVTIGEKIGKEHLNYAQGASSNIIAACTLSLSSNYGLPVSTTQILSSGIAGSMAATSGFKNLRMKTIRNIFIAWLLTLPVTIVMSGLLFLLFRLFL